MGVEGRGGGKEKKGDDGGPYKAGCGERPPYQTSFVFYGDCTALPTASAAVALLFRRLIPGSNKPLTRIPRRILWMISMAPRPPAR